MRFPFRRKALTISPEVADALRSGALNTYPTLGQHPSVQRIRSAFNRASSGTFDFMWRNSPAVRTTIDLITRNLAQLDIGLYREVAPDQREPAPDHPAAQVIAAPNPSQSFPELVLALAQEYLVYGNAYALTGQNPVDDSPFVVPLPAARVEVMGERVMAAEEYRLHTDYGGFTDFPAESIFHWRTWNSLDPRIGVSPLETLRSLVGEEAAIIQANVELAQSGLLERTWVKRPVEAPDWSVEARERFREGLANRLKDANRTPPILDEGMTLESLGISPRDAQMYEVRRMIQERIAAEFGVLPPMVGLDGDVEKAQSAFYADVLPPLSEQLAYQLTRAVCRNLFMAPDLCFVFDIDEKLLGDDRLRAITSAVGAPPLTRNEGRAMLNQPALDGGDELVTPLNVLVGDNPKPSPQVMPIQDPNKPPQDGSYRQNGAKRLDTSPVPHRIVVFRRQQEAISEVKMTLEAFVKRQLKTVKSAKAFDTERWNAELEADLLPVIRSIFRREGDIQIAHLGGHDFDTAMVANYTKKMASDIARNFNQAAQQRLEDFGEDAHGWIKGEHVAIVATSIGARATVKARQEAAKQAPQTQLRFKTWIADTERHAELDGVSVPLDSDWGGIEPGSEPNCACTCAIS